MGAGIKPRLSGRASRLATARFSVLQNGKVKAAFLLTG
jgi:hypothetical protein